MGSWSQVLSASQKDQFELLKLPKQLSFHLPLLSADLVNDGGDWGSWEGSIQTEPTNMKSQKKI